MTMTIGTLLTIIGSSFLVYLIVGFVLTTAFIASDEWQYRHAEAGTMAMGMFLWPFFLVFFGVGFIFVGLTALSRKIVKKVYYERAEDDPA